MEESEKIFEALDSLAGQPDIISSGLPLEDILQNLPISVTDSFERKEILSRLNAMDELIQGLSERVLDLYH